ncbi:MAG: diacylglycerol kinase family protein [bacterium]
MQRASARHGLRYDPTPCARRPPPPSSSTPPLAACAALASPPGWSRRSPPRWSAPPSSSPPAPPPPGRLIAEVREGLLVVAGGDGAINLAVNALADPAPALAIIPSGTARRPGPRPRAARRGRLRRRGAGGQIRLRGCAHRQWPALLHDGGLGLPALVAQAANTVKRQRGTSLLGHHLYAAVAGSQILARRRLRRRIRLDWVCADTGAARHLEAEVYGVLVTNVGAVAGSLRLCEARPDDGVFGSVCCPRPAAPGCCACCWPSPGPARSPGDPAGPSARGRRLQVAEPTPFLGDGGILARTSAFELGVLPAALCVVAP